MDEEQAPIPQTEADRGSFGRQPPTRVGTDSLPPPGSVCCACRRLVLQAQQLLPYMAAYICVDCRAQGESKPILENDITNKVLPPWSKAQIDAINEYQKAEKFLPFVCSKEHVLFADEDGLHCSKCPSVKVLWIYSWILEGTHIEL